MLPLVGNVVESECTAAKTVFANIIIVSWWGAPDCSHSSPRCYHLLSSRADPTSTFEFAQIPNRLILHVTLSSLAAEPSSLWRPAHLLPGTVPLWFLDSLNTGPLFTAIVQVGIALAYDEGLSYWE
jgi:hypothetical protein